MAGEKTSKEPTSYVVLAEQDGSYDVLGKYEARTPVEAIKEAVAEIDAVEGTFVAVPERSWQPKRVQAQRSVKLTLSDSRASQGAGF